MEEKPRLSRLTAIIAQLQSKRMVTANYLPMYLEFPGWNAMVGELVKSRGWGTPDNKVKEKGDFVFIYVFVSIETKEHYFPGDGSWTDAVVSGIAKHQSAFDDFFDKYLSRINNIMSSIDVSFFKIKTVLLIIWNQISFVRRIHLIFPFVKRI